MDESGECLRPPSSSDASGSEWQVALKRLKREVDEKAKALQASSSFLTELKLKAQDSLYSAYRDVEPLEESGRTEDRRVSGKIKELLSSIQTLTSVPRVPQAEPLDKVLLDGPRFLTFFGKKGSNVQVSGDGRLASRLKEDVSVGNLVLGDFPCRVTSSGVHVELVVKKQRQLAPSSSSLSAVDGLTVGFTVTNPKTFAQVPKSSVNVPESLLVGFNGQSLDGGSFASTDGYHPALLKTGDRVSLLVPSYGSLTGRLVLLVNGKVQSISHSRLPVLERHLFLVVDLLGVTEAVSLASAETPTAAISIAELELLVKHPVETIRGSFVDKHGSNVKISGDRKMAMKIDQRRDFGNLFSVALPEAEDRVYFELRVKRLIGSSTGKQAKHTQVSASHNRLRIGVLHQKPEMLPPLISQMNSSCTWLEVGSLQTSTAVGLLVEPHRLSVFVNGVLTGTRETAAEGAVAGLVELLGEGVACVSVSETAERLLYTKLELARVQAVEAARYVQRVYRSVKRRRRWRQLVRLVLVKNNFKRQEENRVEKLLEQQILLQHRLLEKIDKIHDRPINADAPATAIARNLQPAPLQLPNNLGAVLRPISTNVSVDTAFRSVARLDDYKTQLTVNGVDSYCKLLFSCDKKTLGVNVGLLRDSQAFDFLLACNLNGDVFIDGAPGPKLQPKPLHEGEVIEVAVDNKKFIVLVNNKLLCRLDIPHGAGKSFVPGVVGLEMWGGARSVAFFGDPRMQSLLPRDAKVVTSPAKKYNVQPRAPPEAAATVSAVSQFTSASRPSRRQHSPASSSSQISSPSPASSRFSGSLAVASGGNFFQKVIDLIPGDMLGASSSDDDYLKTQPLNSDIRGSKVVPKRRPSNSI